VLVLKALLLGVVEGLTEFLPVSSTGHLIIAGAWLDYPAPHRATFQIFIQLGAILAVYWRYRRELAHLVQRSAREPAARAFLFKLLLAFAPAGAAGFLGYRWIEAHLFSVPSVALALVAGGVIILAVERRPPRVTVSHIDATSWNQAAWIGVAQIASLFPGISRAAATIVGGLLTGLSRPAATQFSFYLALPTMTAASLFSLAQHWAQLTPTDVAPFAAGFGAAFVSALVVIRLFVAYVQAHDFRVFGYYRIALGLLLLLIL
jgi:undecaprenyl-diphosphatase